MTSVARSVVPLDTMQLHKGFPVSPGVAIGEALIVDTEGFRFPRRFVTRDVVEEEVQRLDRAIVAVGEEIERNRAEVTERLGGQYGAIFSAQWQMLNDQQLRLALREHVRDRHFSPEYAVSRTLRQYAKVFQSLESGTHQELANDIFDIEKRVLRQLLGRRRDQLSHLPSPVVVLAQNLTPSETANLDRQNVLGFATEFGGPGGHTAIVAEALELPAVAGIGRFMADVSGGETVIVDGDHGQVILQPDEETLARYRHELEEHRTLAVRLKSLRDLPAETTDGTRIELLANIEFPYEVDSCRDRGADGIGLYRTEFLYLGSDLEPTESVQFDAYETVARSLNGLPVAIRTVDLGADKMSEDQASTSDNAAQTRNPDLGLRSIRLSLRNLEQFRTQLRAVLRASVCGNISVMFPLITTIDELRQTKMVIADVMEDLEDEGVPFNANIPTGIMVEVPAAVVMLDTFLAEVDFASLGTNDLIQYSLAVDRTNKDVASLYDAGDPAVLRLIEMSVRASRQASVPINLCGQMSGSTTYTMLLIGLGFRSLSMAPSAIPEIKKICRSVNVQQCEALAQRALKLEYARDVNHLLKTELHEVAPELAMFA